MILTKKLRVHEIFPLGKKNALDKYLRVIRCASRAIWAKNCKCASWMVVDGSSVDVRSGGWRREGKTAVVGASLPYLLAFVSQGHFSFEI